MCCVCGRLSGKQRQMSCFHKAVQRHCSGYIGELTFSDVKFPEDSVHQQVLKSVHFFDELFET